VLGYNIPGVSNLVLTEEQIVGIYNGSFNNWSDPAFTKHNPRTNLPNASIVPVARYESSGSTAIFSTALSSFSAAWATNFGVFNKKTGWNASAVKVFAQRNSGMADYILREPYRIGYLSAASANEVKLPYALIVNKRGRVTDGGKRSVQAAMDERAQNMTTRLTSSLIDCEGEETYPIAGYSYFIVRMTQVDNCSAAIELARYIEWFLTSAQAEAEVDNHLMVPVSPDIANRIRRSVLERMTCNGQSLMDLVRQQKYNEEESLKTWKLPVQIASPLIAACVLFLIAYAIRQRVKYLRMWDRDDWNIDFVVPNEYSRSPSHQGTTNEGSSISGNCLDRGDIKKVVTRPFSIASVFDVNRKVKQVLMRMRDEIGHENVARFFGISKHDDDVYLVEQYCSNGKLIDFFRENQYIVNQPFLYVVCADIANGMMYLHRQNLIHGNLSIDKCHVVDRCHMIGRCHLVDRSHVTDKCHMIDMGHVIDRCHMPNRCHVIDKCHVDSHLNIKIVEWEYTAMYEVMRHCERNRAKSTRDKCVLHFICREESDGVGDCSRKFRHLAPEIQKDGRLTEPTRAGDVYSFGVIVGDVFLHSSGQELQQTSAEDPPDLPITARQVMKLACAKVAIKRPTFDQLERSMRNAVVGGKSTLLDRCLNCVIHTYSCLAYILLARFVPNVPKRSIVTSV